MARRKDGDHSADKNLLEFCFHFFLSSLFLNKSQTPQESEKYI